MADLWNGELVEVVTGKSSRGVDAAADGLGQFHVETGVVSNCICVLGDAIVLLLGLRGEEGYLEEDS